MSNLWRCRMALALVIVATPPGGMAQLGRGAGTPVP
jgi:hypothetical protein